MGRIPIVKYENATPEQKEVFDQIKKKLGRIPNIYAGVGNSPVMLKALMDLGGTLKGGVLNAKEIEAIALIAAEVNDCYYCAAAHTAIAKMAGVSDPEILRFRAADSEDKKVKALAALTAEIVKTDGRPSDAKLDAFFAAGYDTRALVEVIGFVALNIFTNYFNHIADTPVDFPEVKRIS